MKEIYQPGQPFKPFRPGGVITEEKCTCHDVVFCPDMNEDSVLETLIKLPDGQVQSIPSEQVIFMPQIKEGKVCCEKCFDEQMTNIYNKEICLNNHCPCHKAPEKKCVCGKPVASPYSEVTCSNFPHCKEDYKNKDEVPTEAPDDREFGEEAPEGKEKTMGSALANALKNGQKPDNQKQTDIAYGEVSGSKEKWEEGFDKRIKCDDDSICLKCGKEIPTTM